MGDRLSELLMEPAPGDWATEQAREIAKLIRHQNWKRGGALTVDSDEAAELIAQALRIAKAEGEKVGLAQGFDAAGKVIDNVFGGKKASEHLKATGATS